MNVPDAVHAVFPTVLDDLAALVAIPSVSALPQHAADVTRSAEWVRDQLAGLGCPEVRIVAEGGMPAVIGHFPAPAGAPTVCLYAHHDVQPTGALAEWSSDPFVVREADGRLFARGVADDKAGVLVHLAALRAFGGRPPVGVVVFVEGEEEIGSPSLADLIARHHDDLAADLYVIADSVNWGVGQPAFTTTLRGLVDCTVEVSTLDHALHSGQFGGPVPDALTTLCRLLATLHDDAGNVAIEGLGGMPDPALDYPEDQLRAEAAVLPGVRLLGTGTIAGRLWAKPTATVLGIDATSVADASNTLAPTARAKVSVRIAPDADPTAALAALTEHLRRHAPWGAQVTVTDGSTGSGTAIAFDGPVGRAARAAFVEAWGVEPAFIGQGGSIPMVADFQQAFGAADVLVTAVSDPDSRPHGIDESLHLDDFKKACLAEALLLAKLAEASQL
ncbi:M20/M25/M40 family metallo-hydrolase [Micropruina sp.]|uniref:M20/M25/M40 family metallo-hydrolase n=1 Tax=Micropruina sp. TaxID=2737536 RepID=UPI0039E3F6F6